MATMAQAIRMALHYGEENLGVTDIFGEDVGPPLGGVFTCTQGLKTAYNSPLDERGIIGCALGLALAGQRPVCEIQFGDYIFNTIDLLKIVGNSHWASIGQFEIPLVCMTIVGAGIHGSIYHSHSFESIASHIPGWKIVLPSTPIDAYGMMISAIKDPNPVMFLYPKALIRVKGTELIPGEPEDEKELHRMIDAPTGPTLYHIMEARKSWKPEWPKGLTDYQVPFGKAKIVQEGSDITIVTYARHVFMAKEAADKLKQTEGISAEIIDLRTLYPWDRETVMNSVRKTGRVLILNEDTPVTNFGEHIYREIVDTCFYELVAKPRVLAGADVPGVGLHPNLEFASIPQVQDIEKAILAICSEKP
ncbi:MAG: alpha-ketoacid dehydrogenase subunit beta [Acidobacteria bacterium]|nr:alpha-ketoacid dehydrogenase subunit beta [Acidobacteriota bacterium]MCB9397523.1 alpha-ketoacid dehydrogenase subunit beta [Acidobacteriota bacterium]